MKFKDIPDMSRFLLEDCYCPGEIYGIDGFFCEIFCDDNKCEMVDETEDAFILLATSSYSTKPQAIYFWRDDPERPGQIVYAQRVDATENNIEILKTILHGGKPDGRKFDEYTPGSTAKSVQKVLDISDAIMIN